MYSSCIACWELVQYCSMSNCLSWWLNLKSWENNWIYCEQILFFFFLYNKTLNWLLLRLLCSGYLFWLEELFESWIFLQCSPCCFCTAYVATPARSHGNSYIIYEVANLYEFVRTHSYKFIRFLLNLTYFTSCQFVGICTNDLHLTPPLSLPVTWV